VDSASWPERSGQQGPRGRGIDRAPLEWLLFSEFPSCWRSFTSSPSSWWCDLQFDDPHRQEVDRAAYDAGATGWQTLVNVVIPLAKPGIVIGSIFVITIVMGDFVTIGVMGGQQIAFRGKIIEARLNALQFPAAAANAVILLGITILIISSLTRIVDIRKEL